MAAFLTRSVIAADLAAGGAHDRREWHGPVRRSSWLATFAVLLASNAQTAAQTVQRSAAVLDLPRPGYEPRRLRFGSLVVSPEVLAEGAYDSNVYATSTDADADFAYSVTPRVAADLAGAKLRLQADAYASYRGYAENDEENSTAFGLGTAADYSINRANAISGRLRFDRSVQSRTDPEVSAIRSDAIDIDNWFAAVNYSLRFNRIGIGARAEAQRVNFLPAAERDRDLYSYRGSLRTSVEVGSRFDVFVEGYANYRDHDARLDRSGIDRDVTTLGLLGGTSIDIAEKWTGQIGLGTFRADPSDPSLRSFSGFAANGNLTWWPDARSSLTANLSRGDVATVRAGASGRIDTSASLRYEQEVRHNLLLRASAGYGETTYRSSDRRLRHTSVGGEVEYLINNHASLIANAAYTHRTARSAIDRFNRVVTGVALRLRY